MRLILPTTITIILFTALLASCKKGNPVTPNHSGPAMQALSSSVNADGSITLTGFVNYIPDSLKVYGFEYGTDSLFQTSINFATSTQPIALGTFQLTLSTGAYLKPNTKYYYSPFYSYFATKDGFGFYPGWFRDNVKSFTTGSVVP